jgi:opacity protein-like surface antigen
MSTSKSLVVIPIAALLMASASSAQDSKPDFGRPGWYLGVGAGGAWDILASAIEDATVGAVELSPTGSFNARGGYRATSWFAFELMYEGIYNLPADLFGDNASNSTTHSFLGNFKFIVPTWRIQPYLMVGPGGQLSEFRLGGKDTSNFDFALRLALGIDGYITEHWLINVEVAPSAGFVDWGDIPSEATDNVMVTFGLGLQYRF